MQLFVPQEIGQLVFAGSLTIVFLGDAFNDVLEVLADEDCI